MCLFNANCLPEKWINSNTPSKAVLQIFNSVNFSFRCTSCIDKISIDDQSHLSIPDIPTSEIQNSSSAIEPSLRSIAGSIDEIKIMLSKNSINTGSLKKTYADTLKKSTD